MSKTTYIPPVPVPASVKERLDKAMRSLLLVGAAIDAIEARRGEDWRLADASSYHVTAIYDELYWIREIGGHWLEQPAPDDDQRETIEQMGGAR